MNFFIFFFILLTRLILISPNSLFFDSPEYLIALNQNSIIKAVIYGHLPTHPLFIFLGKIIGSVSLISVISGLISAVFLFLLVKKIFGEKIATYSILIFSFLPYVWLSQTNFTIESLLIMFFLGAYWFFYKFFEENKSKVLPAGRQDFFLALVFFIFSLLTHFSILIFGLSFFGLLPIFGFNKKNVLRTILLIAVGLVISVIFYLLPFYLNGSLTNEVVRQSLFMHLGERVDLFNFPIGSLRYLRNAFLILIRSSTFIVLGLSAWGLFILRKSQNKLWFLIIFFLPFLYSSQFWHVGQFGRTSLPALIPLSILTAVALEKSKYIYLLLLYLIIAYAPTIYRYKASNQPLLTMQNEQTNLIQGGLLFDSHLSRPFTSYQGEIIHVGFLESKEKTQTKINQYLKENNPVYLDSFALFDPYLSYDASTLHILGMGKFGVSDAKEIFSNNYLKLETVGDVNSRVFVYKIVKNSSQKILPVESKEYVILSGQAKLGTAVYVYSNRWYERLLKQRFDYFDPISWIWTFISGRHEPLVWTYADKAGNFEIPIPKEVENYIQIKKEI